MLFDFHTHTFLSDGVLSPIELMRRAAPTATPPWLSRTTRASTTRSACSKSW